MFVFCFLNRENILTPELTSIWLKDIFTFPKRDTTFPLNISGSKTLAQNFELVNGNIVLVSDTSYMCFNKNGSLISESPHTYSKPVLKTCEDKILIYDLNHEELQIGFKSNLIEKIKCKNKILSASVSKNGMYTVASLLPNGNCNLEVFKVLRKEPILSKQFAQEYITDVVLSKNGKIVAMVSNALESGEVTSKIRVLNTKDGTEKFNLNSKNNMMFFIDFISSKNILALGDKTLAVVNAQSGKRKDYNFENKKITAFTTNKDTGFALALSSSESGNDGEILLFNKNGDLKNTIKTNLKISALSYVNNVIAALAFDKIYFFETSNSNKPNAEIACGNGVKNIKLISNKKVFVFNTNKIYIASAN